MVSTQQAKVEMPVARWVDFFGGFIERHRKLWVSLGRLETRFVSEKIKDVAITRPIYICGLARAGSTILLEVLASHEATVSHCYKDFPPVYTPYWWNKYLDLVPKREEIPLERAHKDRILINWDSPEAMEEILWMTFFPQSHDPEISSVLTEFVDNPDFESFYRDHIKKLLVVGGGQRYLAKGNYNITRMDYLLKLFPDVRFVVPVREPCAHVASLLKQHSLFCRGEEENPRALEYMRRVGHFEFGLDRRPVNTGDHNQVKEVLRFWEEGRGAQGYAKQWSAVYGFLADRLEENKALREATLVIRYEDLCADSETVLQKLFDYVELFDAEEVITRYAGQISLPTYYKPNLSEEEKSVILRETAGAANRFEYP